MIGSLRLPLGMALLAAAGLLSRHDAGGPRWTVHSAHALGARTAAFADGGRLLVTVPHEPGERDRWAGPVEVRETATGRLMRSLWEGETFREFSISADGSRVVGLTSTNTLHSADTLTGKTWRRVIPPRDRTDIHQPDANLVFVQQFDLTKTSALLAFQADDGEPMPAPGPLLVAPIRIAGGRLFAPLPAGIAIWDLTQRHEIGRIEGASLRRFEVCTGGTRLYSWSNDPTSPACLWDITDASRPRGLARRSALAVEATHVPHLSDGGVAVLSHLLRREVWASDLRTGSVVWRLSGFGPLASSKDGARIALFRRSMGQVLAIIRDIPTGLDTPCHLPPLTNAGNARFTSAGALWLQATVEPQHPQWWVPAWLVSPATEHQRLYAINADGRPTFTLAGRDLCGYLPLDDGSAVVTFHQHDGAQRMSLHDARHAPVWPRVAAALLGLAGVALLLAALWPPRGVTPARAGPASGSP